MSHMLPRSFRSTALLAPAAVWTLAACADAPLPTAPQVGPPSLAVSNFPPESPNGTWEGKLYVCKDGTGPTGTNFTFDWVLKRDSDGGTESQGTLVVPLGSCGLAVDVGTVGVLRFNAEVTMRTPPVGFSLVDIDHTYGSSTAFTPPTPTTDVGARRISGVGVTNDFGAVVTFITDFDLPAYCTLTQGYWKNHPEDWDAVADGAPFLTTTTFYNSGQTYLTILNTPPKGGNAYLQLAHQFIAAMLNVDGGSSGVASVDAALAGAAAYFASAPSGIPSPTGSLRTQLQGWATTLDNFNNGLIGPGHCED